MASDRGIDVYSFSAQRIMYIGIGDTRIRRIELYNLAVEVQGYHFEDRSGPATYPVVVGVIQHIC